MIYGVNAKQILHNSPKKIKILSYFDTYSTFL